MTLLDIKDYLSSLVQSFAALLDLELTVLSNDPSHLNRIAGTGVYDTEKVNSDIAWQKSYTRRVLESGTPLVVLDTANLVDSMLEENRPFYSKYYSIILHPILCEKKIVGVIVIASFNECQQKLLISKKDRLMDYLSRTAEMITLKLERENLQERTETVNKQLNLINETIENGVVLYSNDAGIQQINERARHLLRIDNSDFSEVLLKDTIELARTADEAGKKCTREIYHSINGRSSLLTVQALPLNNAGHDVLCVITPFAQVQNTILQNAGGEISDDAIVAVSKEMCQLLERVKTAAQHTSNVLILGESGVGKEMFARMIHSCSGRKSGPFVSINCAAIPEALLESELFGYEEGAFTGAHKGGRIGKFMLADKGTLFLDEIGDMPLYLQAKLLRVLSERKVDRLGGAMPVSVDVRIVAATNRNLEALIESRQFRQDLYYRLSVIPFEIPPLRARKEDILPLSKYFIQKYNKKLDKHIEGLSSDVLNILMDYDWPGNVRELENCLEYMMNFERGNHLSRECMPPKIFERGQTAATLSLETIMTMPQELHPLKEMLLQYERKLFNDFAASYDGGPSLKEIDRFCKALHISRATYYRKKEKSQI